MRRQAIDCDKCRSKDVSNHTSVSIPYKTQIDSPSGRTETVDREVNFCSDCASKIFIKMVGSIVGSDVDAGVLWVEKYVPCILGQLI